MNSFVDKWFPPGTPKGASHTTVIKHIPIANFFSTKLIGGQHDLLSLLIKIIYNICIPIATELKEISLTFS